MVKCYTPQEYRRTSLLLEHGVGVKGNKKRGAENRPPFIAVKNASYISGVITSMPPM